MSDKSIESACVTAHCRLNPTLTVYLQTSVQVNEQELIRLIYQIEQLKLFLFQLENSFLHQFIPLP